ncbi:hypothetical protein MMC29_003200 [Sticta canariensis]|nr:hypothetical protein [Sticta canariensis]
MAKLDVQPSEPTIPAKATSPAMQSGTDMMKVVIPSNGGFGRATKLCSRARKATHDQAFHVAEPARAVATGQARATVAALSARLSSCHPKEFKGPQLQLFQ